MRFHTGLRALSGALAISALSLAWVSLASAQSPVKTSPLPETTSRATSTIAPAAPSTLFTPGEDYLLGPGDVVNVSIYADPDLSRDCRITSDGYIVMPYLADHLKAAGKTAEQLQDTVSAAYKAQNILKNPQANVSVKEFHSSPVSVGGSVAKQTTFQVQGHTTLWQAIMMAEGFTSNAGPRILVTRATRDANGKTTGGGETTVILRHDLSTRPNDPNVNVIIRGGDSILVTPPEYVYVGGAVLKPGMLAVADVSDWTLLKALAAVGNMTKVAASEHAAIMRPKPDGNGRDEIAVDLKKVLKRQAPDLPLMANDILLIPESAGRKAMYKAADTVSGLVTGLALTGVSHP